MKFHSEEAFEAYIVDHLVAHGGWKHGDANDYDCQRAFLTADLVGYLQEAQPKPGRRSRTFRGANIPSDVPSMPWPRTWATLFRDTVAGT